MKTTLKRFVLTAIFAALSVAVSPTGYAAAEKSRVIEVTGSDAMKFNVSEITAKPGEALGVKLTNIGSLPKAAMSHNWVLLKPMTDAEIAKFATAAMSKAPEYLPEDKSGILAHTKMLGAKETDTIEFKAPTEPGEYPFVCTFPGHYALMKGKLIVK